MTASALAGVRPVVRDLAGELLYALGLTRPRRCAAGRLTIVTLHRVLPPPLLQDYPLPQLAVSVEELAWLLRFLRAHFSCATLSEAHRRWVSGERPPKPLLAVTFDDGQGDNFDHARPLLERAGVPGTFFVPVESLDRGIPLWHDRLGWALHRLAARDAVAVLAAAGLPASLAGRGQVARAVAAAKHLSAPAREALVESSEHAAGGSARPAWDRPMSWAELRALVAGGHEIGSHTLTHPLLTSLGDAELEREVVESRTRLEAGLDQACEAFCYPNGDRDDRVVGAVRRAGYRRAVTTAWGSNARREDPLLLKRCDLQGATSRDRSGTLSESRLALRLSPAFARLAM